MDIDQLEESILESLLFICLQVVDFHQAMKSPKHECGPFSGSHLILIYFCVLSRLGHTN